MRTVRTDSEKAALYSTRVRKAKEDQQKWAAQAQNWVNRYRNVAFEDDFTDEGNRISTPRGLAIIDAMFSSLTAVDVEINIQPWGQGTIDQAQVAEQAVMEVWREAKVSRKAREAVKDALLVGIGWMKVGYDYAEHDEVQEKEPQRLDAELEELYRQVREEGTPPPSPEDALDTVGTHETVTIVDRDRVVVDYVPWRDVVWDPTAKRVEDVRWIAQVTYLPIDEVKGNPAWREYVKQSTGSYKVLEDLKPDSKILYEGEDQTPVYSFDPDHVSVDDEDARVAVVEYWDLSATGGTFCTLPLNADFLLNEQANPLGFEEDMEDRSPFVPLVTRKNPNRVRGISDMEIMEPSLMELNRYRSGLLNYLERYHPKVAGRAGLMTEAGKAALMSRTDRFVELDQGANPNELKDINPPVLPSQMFGMPDLVENELKEATGVSEVQRGVFPDRKRTATETAEVVAASSARQSEKRNLMEDFFTDIARRILHLMQTFYDVERISRLVEPDRDVIWEWNAEDITMDVDLEVVLAPKTPRDSTWREERALKLVNFVAPIIGQPQLHPLARVALKEMGYPAYIIRQVLPTEEELAEQQQQEAAQQAQATAMEAEAQAVGAASGDPTIPGGVNGPGGDMSWAEQMGPEGVYEDAASQLSATGYLPTP
jgi:hypothetical protein